MDAPSERTCVSGAATTAVPVPPCPAHADNDLRLPARRPLPADYGFAIQVLLSDYSDVLTAAELKELRLFSAQPALPPLKRARLSVLASVAVTRAAEVRHGG
jgi:hypothetical protein